MNLNNIFLLIIELVIKNFAPANLNFKTQEKMQDSVKTQVLSVMIKFLAGITVTSVIIFSLLSAVQQINVIILANENGALLSVLFFSFLTILGCIGLFFIFKKSAPRLQHSRHEATQGIDLQKTFSIFCASFSEGLKKSNKSDELKDAPSNI